MAEENGTDITDSGLSDSPNTNDSTADLGVSDGTVNNVDNNRIQELQAEVDRLAERAQLLDSFEANPEATLRNVAERLGMELVNKQAGNADQNQESSKPPQSFVDTISQNLAPEMQFMAQSLAQASWAAHQAAIQPFQQQQEQTARAQLDAERQAIVAEMDAAHPEWKQSLNQMEELYNFLKTATNGGSMRSPKFGSLQEVLFKLATGDKSAATIAAARMRDAGRNATSTGDNQSPAPVDVDKQIREAKSTDDKFEIAFRAAMAEHGNL